MLAFSRGPHGVPKRSRDRPQSATVRTHDGRAASSAPAQRSAGSCSPSPGERHVSRRRKSHQQGAEETGLFSEVKESGQRHRRLEKAALNLAE